MQDGRIHDMRPGQHEPVLTGLVGNLVVFVGLPLVVNGLIFGLGWERTSGPQPGLPPGWAVGAIWLVLFAGMGVARWLLLRAATTRKQERRVEWVSALGFLCLLYPFYTVGFSNLFDGLVGNVATLLVAVPVAVYAFRRRLAAGWCLAPPVAWLSYAAWATARLVYR